MLLPQDWPELYIQLAASLPEAHEHTCTTTGFFCEASQAGELGTRTHDVPDASQQLQCRLVLGMLDDLGDCVLRYLKPRAACQMNANSNPIAAAAKEISGSDIADTTHWRYLGER